MTPPALRSSLGSVIRCTSGSTPTITIRAFSTTLRCSRIGPESPNFIEVPQPPQQRAPVPRRIRGTLPPPRDVFASRGGKDKSTAQYLRETIPEPASADYFARDEQAAWKRRMAVIRRRNLQEGLEALHIRKIKTAEALEKRSRNKMEWRDKRVYAAPRPDQVYTSSTVRQATTWLQIGPLPDPDREARVAAAAARVQAKEAEREAARQDALHSLYMHARSFITTEEQLNEKINDLFKPLSFKNKSGQYSDNIWDTESAPPSVQDLLDPMNKTQKTLESYAGPAGTIGKRTLRIAEELTGGKIDTRNISITAREV